MEEESSDSPMWRLSQSRMSRRMTSTPTSSSTSYSFSFVAHEATMVSPLDWFSSHSRHVVRDERDGIQKKTFTKWVNKHLAKKMGCKPDAICCVLYTIMCTCGESIDADLKNGEPSLCR
ncbi:hypothetical protein GCK32_018584 [Trichostrongylus colubriformis]|uniref:Calponin-homology (CH) domain-containing protein n=1 Tax=Trichostrongylus colubriformis TaxID=6319 RepID=A0AAN8EZN1_TRICO